MSEIFLSFFAVVGITLLVVYLFDYLFYHKMKKGFTLFVDLEGMSDEEIIESLEMIHSARSRASGAATIQSIVVVIEEDNGMKDRVYRYMNLYTLPGKVYFKSDPSLPIRL